MKKKSIIIALGLVLMLSMQVEQGCIMFGIQDKFQYVYQPPSREVEKKFIPPVRLAKKTTHFSLLLVSLGLDSLPHSLVMSQYDPTYLKREKGHKSFVLDELYIEYADRTRVDCIDPSLPENERSYPVKQPLDADSKKRFEIIDKRMDFTVHIIGTAIKESGEVVPFHRTNKYKYYGKGGTFYTILDVWMDI